MRKWMRGAGRILVMMLCTCMSVSCASSQEMQQGQETQDGQAAVSGLSAEERESVEGRTAETENGAEAVSPDEESRDSEKKGEVPDEEGREPDIKGRIPNAGGQNPDAPEPDAEETAFSPERQMRENKEQLLEKAKEQKIGTASAEELFGRLLADGVFQDGRMALTGLVIDDLDGNGQADMLVMVQEAEQRPAYGSGGLWFYMNEEEPYCFEEEACSFCGWFDVFWDDVDNDGNVEIIFSAEGTGCGAVGDSYKAVFQYKDHAIGRMALPSDLEEEYDCGLRVELVQEPMENVYSAYCPYFDELISFRGENAGGGELPDAPQIAGGNARGFYNLCTAEYDGKKALQASEYLYGEGGTAHHVATAQFLITWEKDGTPKVVKWWIEEAEDGWANSKKSCLCYEKGTDLYNLYNTNIHEKIAMQKKKEDAYFSGNSD